MKKFRGNRERAGSISGRLRAMSDLADVGAIDPAQKTQLKDMLISGDAEVTAAVDEAASGNRDVLNGVLRGLREGRVRTSSIDQLLDNIGDLDAGQFDMGGLDITGGSGSVGSSSMGMLGSMGSGSLSGRSSQRPRGRTLSWGQDNSSGAGDDHHGMPPPLPVTSTSSSSGGGATARSGSYGDYRSGGSAAIPMGVPMRPPGARPRGSSAGHSNMVGHGYGSHGGGAGALTGPVTGEGRYGNSAHFGGYNLNARRSPPPEGSTSDSSGGGSYRGGSRGSGSGGHPSSRQQHPRSGSFGMGTESPRGLGGPGSMSSMGSMGGGSNVGPVELDGLALPFSGPLEMFGFDDMDGGAGERGGGGGGGVVKSEQGVGASMHPFAPPRAPPRHGGSRGGGGMGSLGSAMGGGGNDGGGRGRSLGYGLGDDMVMEDDGFGNLLAMPASSAGSSPRSSHDGLDGGAAPRERSSGRGAGSAAAVRAARQRQAEAEAAAVPREMHPDASRQSARQIESFERRKIEAANRERMAREMEAQQAAHAAHMAQRQMLQVRWKEEERGFLLVRALPRVCPLLAIRMCVCVTKLLLLDLSSSSSSGTRAEARTRAPARRRQQRVREHGRRQGREQERAARATAWEQERGWICWRRGRRRGGWWRGGRQEDWCGWRGGGWEPHDWRVLAALAPPPYRAFP